MLQSLFYAAWELATNWVKNDSRKWITDKVKPTSIVEEDENLPRVPPPPGGPLSPMREAPCMRGH